MKKIAAAILMSAFLCATGSAHQDEKKEENRRWLKISVDGPLALFGAYWVQGEYRLSDCMTFLTSFGYVDTRWTINSNVGHLPGTFGHIGAGMRYYARPENMSGFFLEDYVIFEPGRTFSGNQENDPIFGTVGPNMFALANALHIGYSWVTDFGLFFDVMGGITTSVYWGIGNAPSFYDMNHIEARMNVGWAF